MAYPGRDRPALGPLSLTIGPGELIMLTGPSGAGKTTLLRLLLRFIEPTSGTARVGGTDLAAVPVGLLARPDRLGPAASAAVRRIGGRQHRPRPARRHPGAPSRTPPGWPARPHSSRRSRAAMTPRWENGRPGCRPGSASSSPWPGRSCGTPRCCCSTSRPPTWPPPPPPRSMASSAARWPGARSSWPPTGTPVPSGASQVITLDGGRPAETASRPARMPAMVAAR